MSCGRAADMDPSSENSKADHNFQSADVGMLLQELSKALQRECAAAAARHRDILGRMVQQQQAHDQRFLEIRRDLSACHVTNKLLPKTTPVAPLAPEAPEAPDAPIAPEIELYPTALESNECLKHAQLTAVPNEGSQALDSCSDRPSKKGGMLDPCTPGLASAKSVSVALSVESDLKTSHSGLSARSHLSHLARSGSKGVSARMETMRHNRSWRTLRDLLVAIVTHNRFECCVATLIMANAIVLCFEVQYTGFQIGYNLKYSGCMSDASAIWPGALGVFQVLDWSFGLLFLLEVVIKLICFVHQYFYDIWNWIDFSCVFGFLVEKIAAQVIPFDAKALRLLRFLRLVRLVRVLRTLESLDQLYVMTTAIKGMYMVLLWAVALLSVILMTESLLLTQYFHAFYFKDVFASDLLSEADRVSRHKFYEYFGSFTRCFLSMYELTLGNWPPVTRLLSEGASEFFMPFCLVHKLTVGFAVIGVITGVILQETFKVALTDDWIMVRQKGRAVKTSNKKMQALFQALDKDLDGTLDWDEFKLIEEIPELRVWLASMDVETDDLQALFMLIDDDNSGRITLDELSQRMPRVRGAARSIDLLKLRQDVSRDMHELAKHSSILKDNGQGPRRTFERIERAASKSFPT